MSATSELAVSPATAVVAAAPTTATSIAGPSPQKALNANAKAFQPKLDAPTLQAAAALDHAMSNRNSSAATAAPPPHPQQPQRAQPLTPSQMPASSSLTSPPASAAPPARSNSSKQLPVAPRVPLMPYIAAPPTMFTGHTGMPLNPALLAAAVAAQGPPRMMMAAPPGVPHAGTIPPPPSPLMNAASVIPPPPFHHVPPGGIPPSPVFFAPPPSPVVNVGNASLAALRSKEPPKFGCVLMVGMPSSGKTTVGRELVNGLNADKLGWQFFSGSDHLKDAAGSRPAFWESTKEVFDALANRLDQLIGRQNNSDTRIKGLVIDKNCRGVEDLLFLSSLLKSKGLPLVGVVGLEVKDDEELLRRMGGGEELSERLKYHRVIQARIVEAAKSAGLYRSVDASPTKASKDQVVQAARTMVLGCSAQPASAVRQLSWSSYSDSCCAVVENYNEYCSVMTTLFSLVKPASSAAQWWDHKFPGFTDYVPLSTRELDDHAKVAALRSSYSVRRKVDGSKHVCVYDGASLYLVPRHMRAVLKLPNEAWLGMSIASVGRLVLDGDLVRLKDRSKEKFVVYDVLFWSDSASPMTNLVRLSSWKDRQERLISSICHEASAFYQKSTECVIVHQRSEPWEKALELLEPLDYPCDGLILQAHQSGHPSYMWRPPQSITCDLRLGPLVPESNTTSNTTTAEPTAAAPQPPSTPDKMVRMGSSSFSEPPPQVTRIHYVEAYDRDLKRYVRLPNERVEVRRSDVVEGCFCVCGLNFDANGDHHWVFHRARYDVSRAAYKSSVDDLVQNCLVARSRLVSWLINEKLVPQPKGDLGQSGSAVSVSGGGGGSSTTDAALASVSSRGAFGVALEQSSGAATAAAASALPNSASAFGSGAGGVSASTLSSSASALFKKSRDLAASNAGAAATSTTSTSSAQQLPASLEMLQRVVSTVKVQSQSKPAQESQPSLQLLESVVGASHINVVRSTSGPTGAAAVTSATGASDTSASRQSSAAAAKASAAAASPPSICAQCGKSKKSEDLRMDERDKKFYCYGCWAKEGTEFCTDCGEFRKGYREQSRRSVGAFYCDSCWDAFRKRQAADDDVKKKKKSEAGVNGNTKTGPKETIGDRSKKGDGTTCTAAATAAPTTPTSDVAEAKEPTTDVLATKAATVEDGGETKGPNGEEKKARRRRGGRGRRKKGSGEAADSGTGDDDDDAAAAAHEGNVKDDEAVKTPPPQSKAVAATEDASAPTASTACEPSAPSSKDDQSSPSAPPTEN